MALQMKESAMTQEEALAAASRGHDVLVEDGALPV
jgi:hypothetical protein